MSDSLCDDSHETLRKRVEELERENAGLREDKARLTWNKWPDESSGEYPPDQTPVLIREKCATGVAYCVGGIDRNRGTFGPSWATHWALIPSIDDAARKVEEGR